MKPTGRTPPRWSLVAPVLLACGCTAPNPSFQPGSTATDGSAEPADASTARQDGPGRQPDARPGLVDGRPSSRDRGRPADARISWDAPRCTPNAFLGCQGVKTTLFCNGTGDGTRTVSCGNYLCNAPAKRCNQCDPAAPAYCKDSELMSCNDGLPVGKLCPDGCVNGACQGCVPTSYFFDADQDGFGDPKTQYDTCSQPGPYYVTNNTDCDDQDASAFPTQAHFFQAPTKGTNDFDYNCDSVETMQYPSLALCKRSGSVCLGDGWVGLVPGCGGLAVFAECKPSGQNACVQKTTGRAQGCR
ncbi:MAG: hypothetical protein IT371_10365 [Deltaproteobacteria bacterium]|nr:hypothetical protein [Deltaproteobacteria bacterium]